MIIIKGDQQTDEWQEIRKGIPTASRFSEIITPAKGELSKSSEGYMKELAASRVWGVREESYTSYHMQNGIDREAQARLEYQALTLIEVEQVRFIYADDRMDRGCSPDGLVYDPGLIEIKSPKLKTHVGYILSDGYPREYKCQIQGELYICEREWCDFISYFPGTDLYIKRVYRDEKFIKKLAEAIDQFNEQLNELVSKLKQEAL